MVDANNNTLDGSQGRETRPVPYWCSENAYAKYPGDTTFNNGRIIWSGGIGYIAPNGSDDPNRRIPAFSYDSALGVTYPNLRVNSLFTGLDNTVPREWVELKEFLESPEASGYSFGEGSTLAIAQDIIWKLWTGLTFAEIAGLGAVGKTYEFVSMELYRNGGGTSSVLLDRYNYGCLDSIIYNDRFAIIGIEDAERDAIWNGAVPGICFGAGGGLSGETYLLNLISGGVNAGSAIVFGKDPNLDFRFDTIYAGASAGATLSGKQLALNIFGIGSEEPFIGPLDPNGGNLGLLDLFALLTGTNQKIITLTDGTTASIRGLDFNSPCSDSFVYGEDSTLGQWGYQVKFAPVTEDVYTPPPEVEVGCNIPTYLEYITGATAKAQGVAHPLSVVYWKGVSDNTEYQSGAVHVETGEIQEDGNPVYDRLEGMHDHLCYEIYGDDGEGTALQSRVYYPLSPVNRREYERILTENYNDSLIGYNDAFAFGATLDLKFRTGFSDAFKGAGSQGDAPISIASLGESGVINITTPESADGITGVSGVMFPYLIPVASNAFEGIAAGEGDLTISGEFNFFDGDWKPEDFEQRYGYYADGVSSGADLENDQSSPILTGTSTPFPDFRLFSWNALSRIRPLKIGPDGEFTAQPVLSSFFFNPSTEQGVDRYGIASYDDNNPNTLNLDGSLLNIDLTSYLPRALQATPPSVGLTFDFDGNEIADPIDCGSFINVARYANTLNPNADPLVNAARGLPAVKELIAQKTLGAELKALADLDPDGLISGDNQSIFRRTGNVANTSGNFYSTVGGNANFFFQTTGPFAVFESPYYLSGEQYAQKYHTTGDQPIWWEDSDINGLIIANGFITLEGLAAEIDGLLISPNFDEAWTTRSDLGFKGSPWSGVFNPDAPESNTIPGVRVALQDGLHPAMLYRLMTTDIFPSLGIDSDCESSWRSGGVPCHQIPAVLAALKDSNRVYSSYFNSTGAGFCNQFGFPVDATNIATDIGQDFFGRCLLEVGGGSPPIGGGSNVFAYGEDYFSPFSTNYSQFQNQACAGGGGDFIADPPENAALTSFGVQFAKALNLTKTNPIDVDTASPLAIRDDLFQFTGITDTIDGVNNSVITTVSEWLTDSLDSIIGYYNSYYADPKEFENVQLVSGVLTTLFGNDFTQYTATLAQGKTYKLWAIKPRCIDSWDEDCINLANEIYRIPTFRFATFASAQTVFDDSKYNPTAVAQSRLTRPTISDTLPTVGNNSTPIRMNDIVTTDGGFVGAMRTVFVEPLGKATSVLASEAQAVPRATITSTVYGRLTTVIDENGFLKDVNILTLESGEGIRVDGDENTGIITVSVDGITLGSLGDVGISGPTGGDILVYDALQQAWINLSFADVLAPYLAGFTGFTGGVAGTNFFYQQTPPESGITVGSRWMDSDTGVEYIYINDGDNFAWVQSSVETNVETPTFVYQTTVVSAPTYQALDTDYYIGVSYAGPVTITLPSDADEGKTVIVKDASGFSSYPRRNITVVGAGSDTIDNEESAIIATNNGALQFIYKNGWRII
jgi:hypothetical protein